MPYSQQSADISPNTPMGTGPYQAIMEQDPGLPTHTEYLPADLAALGNQKLPIVAWGNGGCANAGNLFRNFLTEISSYGFLAIAIGPIRPPDWVHTFFLMAAAQLGTAPPAQRARPQTNATQLIDAINWAIAEDSRLGSKYYGKIDTSKIAVMGQSCGGLQAIAVSADPRVTLTGVWNSGVIAVLPPNAPVMEPMSKDALKKLHAPIFYFTGDQANDIAYPNGMDDFNRIEGVPAFHAYKDGLPHIGTYGEANGGELGKIAVALLMWQLKGDRQAARMFAGPDCTLCRDPKWHVLKKQID